MKYQRSVCIRNSAENGYSRAILEDSELMLSTKKAYVRAITRAIIDGIDLSDTFAIGRYAKTLPHSTAYALRGAMLAYARHMTLILESNVTPESYQATAAAIMRLNAIPNAIKPIKAPKGTRAHIWLRRSEVAGLLASPDVQTVSGLRDWMVLSLLVGAGLRREESTRLKWGDLIVQGERHVIQVKGKGGKYRLVPISSRMVKKFRQWQTITGLKGLIVRRVQKGGKLTVNGVNVAAVNRIVARYGAAIGLSDLQPHDLRRTYAQIGIDNGISIEQISTLLGHASISTTQRYLNIKLDLLETVSDFVPM